MRNIVVSVPPEGLREALDDLPGVEIVDWDMSGPPPRTDIDIVVPPYWNARAALPRVADTDALIVLWQSIGFDAVAEHLPSHVTVCNAASVHEGATAELAVALTLAALRGIPDFVRDDDAGIWNLRRFPGLADKRVLLVGYGGVAQAVEARLSGFEVSITRIARRARTDRDLAGAPVDVLGWDDLHVALGTADVVILAVPLNDATRGVIDADALAAMPAGALLVNVARGAVVDTDALVAELESGRLRAALDVTSPEPLPQDHPLWRCPNVLITPHVGGDSDAMAPRIARLLRRQVENARDGRPLENVVLSPSR